MSTIADAIAGLVAELAAANLPVVSDPRNVRPPAVLVDAPSVRALSLSVLEITVPCVIVAPPPGNADAMTALVTMMDTVFALPIECTSMTATPGVYTIAGQELPSYSVVITLTKP
jgi:hypothetical protein